MKGGEMKLIRSVAVALVITGGVMATAASGDTTSSNASSSGDSSVDKGLGAYDAKSDVGPPELVQDGSLSYAQVRITNHSSKRSNYFVTIVADSPDGATRISDTMVSVMNLDPGQHAMEKGLLTQDLPVGTKLTVIEVQRTAA
jgi:hypothetical protein